MKCQKQNCKFNTLGNNCIKKDEVILLTEDNKLVCNCYKKEEVDCKYVVNLFHNQRTGDYMIIVTFLEENPRDSLNYHAIDRDIFSLQGNATSLVSKVYFDYFMTTGLDSENRFKQGTLTFNKVKDIGNVNTREIGLYTFRDLCKFSNEVVDTYRLRYYKPKNKQ